MAIVYKIENRMTGDRYVGSVLGWPFGRWAEHVSMLTNGYHHSSKFQFAWSRSRPEDWDFVMLESGIGLDFRLSREQFWFETLTPNLNETSRITRMVDKAKTERRALEMLRTKKTYRVIAEELGCSLGWLTNLKRRM